MVPLLLDINGPEFMLLLVLAVILFGPERLPDLARKAARLLRYLRTVAGSAQQQLSKELGPEFENLDFRDLNPKAFVQKHLLDDVEPIIEDVKSEVTDVGKTINSSSADFSNAIAKASQPGRATRRRGWREPDPGCNTFRSRGDLIVEVQRPAGIRPSCLPSSPRPRLMNVSASALRARAAGSSGPVSTSGTPASPDARSCGSSGICARRETG